MTMHTDETELPNLGDCECSDPGCPMHLGAETCENTAISTLFRVDMQDETGTVMCEGCACDAFESGLFRIDED
jgi:hypothetical protein